MRNKGISSISITIFSVVGLFLPTFAHASVDTFIQNFNRLILNPLIILLFAVAALIFMYGVVEMIVGGDNDEKRTTGKMHMLWGLVGLTIMFSVWFLLGLIIDTLNLGGKYEAIDPKEGVIELNDYEPTFPPGFGEPKK